MVRKEIHLEDRGMTRDFSVSQAGQENGFAFDNRNVRLLSDRHDTTLSVTSERGNRAVDGISMKGRLIGWNVLNNYLIVFTTESDEGAYLQDGYGEDESVSPDHIYRVEYFPAETDAAKQFVLREIYSGRLGFDPAHPIESVTDYETEDIQKIYWLDGIHVLRFLDFADAYLDKYGDGSHGWGPFTDDWFDTNKAADGSPDVTIERTQDGNSRANGVVQYFITYYNKNGQETNWVWASPLVYLSPDGRGGEPDGTNTCKVTLTLTGTDASFDYVRLYSVELSSQGADRAAYIVAEASTKTETVDEDGNVEATPNGTVTLIDDGRPLSTEDASSVLFLGSRGVAAGTLAHKDGTLFLGDITVEQNTGIDKLSAMVKALRDPVSGESSVMEFRLTSGEADGIPMAEMSGLYPYENQLDYPNSRITFFKGNEKYRFAVRFRRPDGATTSAFWLGDMTNTLYPKARTTWADRPLAYCRLPEDIAEHAIGLGYTTAQLMMAEATYADRSVKAQGVLSPTMFNVWERFNGRVYSTASWLYRPRNSSFAWKHFEPVHNSTDPTGEIQCNWWDSGKFGEGEMPTPYYTLDSDGGIADPLEGSSVGEYWILLYKWYKQKGLSTGGLKCYCLFISAEANDDADITEPPSVSDAKLKKFIGILADDLDGLCGRDYTVSSSDKKWKFTIVARHSGNDGHHRSTAWSKLRARLIDAGVPAKLLIEDDGTLSTMVDGMDNKEHRWFTYQTLPRSYGGSGGWSSALAASAFTSSDDSAAINADGGTNRYTASAYKKQLMFVDENIVTLNSPELEQEAVDVDCAGLKLRVVGAAKVAGNITDYAADITGGKYSGAALYTRSFNSEAVSAAPDGLQSWPLWLEFGPVENADADDDNEDDAGIDTVSDYFLGSGNTVRWWLHMFQKNGGVSGLPTKADGDDAATTDLINSKTFANLRLCSPTAYADAGSMLEYNPGESKRIRQYAYLSSQLVDISDSCYYNANVNDIINMPGTAKYPVLYSSTTATDAEDGSSYGVSDPVRLTYRSEAHAVINLGNENGAYRLLPVINGSEKFAFGNGASSRRIPWKGSGNDGNTFRTTQKVLDIGKARSNFISSRYLLIGELYRDYSNGDTRYGGVTESAVEACTFIPAGPFTELKAGEETVLTGNEGDTFFQRWDGVKTVPAGENDTNRVIDVASVMVESHVNLDGRYDKQRGSTRLTDIDWDSFGQVNPVYSQADDFTSSVDTDEQADLDSWRGYVTWTLEKHDGAETDEWTHITLASTLKLDGDKGICRALRRYANTLYAFQDRGICEVLFNSRTQMDTSDGTPVELANTGKVDGKRYVSGRYGCTNKWSIAEGKGGLYFADDLNGLIAVLSGNGIDPISQKARLEAWTRLTADAAKGQEAWSPCTDGRQLLAQYDRLRSEVYFFKWNDAEHPCLVYNERLGAFSSFYDYLNVPMLANMGDRLLSWRDGRLWLQNEGRYCEFFGEGHPLWVTWRAAAGEDAIWTNLEYRADFHRLLDEDGDLTIDSDPIIDGTQEGLDSYVPDETLDVVEAWDEYQRTGPFTVRWRPGREEAYPDVRKKFRTWRTDIPRALKDEGNRYGLDRMRNPWLYIRMRKEYSGGRDMMHLHGVTASFFTMEKQKAQ